MYVYELYLDKMSVDEMSFYEIFVDEKGAYEF
jgi:hypothetical protein